MNDLVHSVQPLKGGDDSLKDLPPEYPANDTLEWRVRQAIRRLLKWIEAAPEVTADPSDVKAHPFLMRCQAMRDRTLARVTLKCTYGLAGMFPRLVRRILRIRIQQTAGAVAWMAQGYLALFRLTKVDRHLREAELWLSRLESLRIHSYEDYCWGLPFDWQSRVLLPANTPLLYTTWQAGQAYLEHFELTNECKSLRIATSACRCLLSCLNKNVDHPRCLSLSYSPYDSMQVYNTNALAGSFFYKIGCLTDDAEIFNSGCRMLNWVAEGQRTDGAWEYFSSAEGTREPAIDHYHTAMTLQALIDVAADVRENPWLESAQRGLAFYLNELFDRYGRPKMTPADIYPIDVMSVSEGLILLSRLQNPKLQLDPATRRESLQRRRQLLDWTCRHFQSDQGAFYYRIYRGFSLRLFSFRWGQGAMLKALASSLRN